MHAARLAPIRVQPITFRKCARCELTGERNANGAHYCIKHYRLMRMRIAAKFDGKTVPSYAELESLIPSDMKCPICRRPMNWSHTEGRSIQLVLQHDRSGAHRLMCQGCNVRHGQLPGDMLYQIPEGMRLCRGCHDIKPLSAFHVANDPTRTVKLGSRCKECNTRNHLSWVNANRDRVRSYNRRRYKALRAKS